MKKKHSEAQIIDGQGFYTHTIHHGEVTTGSIGVARRGVSDLLSMKQNLADPKGINGAKKSLMALFKKK